MSDPNSRIDPLPELLARLARLPVGEAADEARSDQDVRWRAGECPPAEQYLAALPGVAADPEHALVLIYGEVLARAERGEQPVLAEYQRRFPQFADRLANQFTVHDALAAASTPGPTTGAYTPDSLPRTTDASDPGHPATGPERIGQYHIVGELGRGGMGLVLAARDPSLDREVAIKTLIPGRADPSAAGRFVRESKITARLPHPGIPPVHELGELPDGTPFLAMKLIRGKTLDQRLRERQDLGEELPQLVQVFEQICQAVGYAHSKGVIHRDLKPANVMVGSFGEVQVMDWGLAKDLALGAGEEDEEAPDRPQPADATSAGAILGTPAFMAPEQARGDAAAVRSDVFALGGILCAILTGKPPFVAATGPAALRLAVAGDVSGARDRLGVCGADHELVAIARGCLSPGPTDRPTTGRDVAELIAAYRAGVEERLQRARAERAAAEAKAEEQRKRRRVQLALAATILVLTIGAAGTILWNERKTSARRAEADKGSSLALGKAEQLAARAREQDLETVAGAEAAVGLWRQAVTTAEQAEGVAGAGGDAALSGRVAEQAGGFRDGLAGSEAALARARRDDALLLALEDALGINNESADVNWSRGVVDRTYRTALNTHGLPAGAPAAELAAVVKAEHPRVREALVRALDHWSDYLGEVSERARVRSAADGADEDPFRKQVRAAVRTGDVAALLRMAEGPESARLPAVSAYLLAKSLERHERRSFLAGAADRRYGTVALRLMRGVRDRHPGDFWAHTWVGELLDTFYMEWLGVSTPGASPYAEEAIGCYRAALALRPSSPMAHIRLGVALARKGDWPRAETCFRTAIALDPGYSDAHTGLGNVRQLQGDSAGAVPYYRAALATSPGSSTTHLNLGQALAGCGETAEAETRLRQGIDLEPEYVGGYLILGQLLLNQKHDHAGAEACFQKAVEVAPGSPIVQLRLGDRLKARGDMAGAEAAYRKAIRVAPKLSDAYYSLGCLLGDKDDMAGAEAAYRKAIECYPKHLEAHNNLGLLLYRASNYAGAEAAYRKAIEINPKHRSPHHNLGLLLKHQKDYPRAEAAFRKAVEADAKHADSHHNLGLVLSERGNAAGAEAAYKEAVASDPKHAGAYYSLGQLLHHKKKDYAGSVAAYRKVIEIDPEHVPAYTGLGDALFFGNGDLDHALLAYALALLRRPFDTRAYIGVGNVRYAKKQYDESVAAYRVVIRLEPENAPGHYGLGNALLEKGNVDGALAAYKTCVDLDPSHARGHRNLGRVLRAKGKLPEAIAAYRESVQHDSKDPIAFYLMGNALHESRDYAGAIAAFEVATKLDPRYTSAHNNLGISRRTVGDWDGAVLAFRRAAEQDPKNTRYQRNLEDAIRRKAERDDRIAPPPRAVMR